MAEITDKFISPNEAQAQFDSYSTWLGNLLPATVLDDSSITIPRFAEIEFQELKDYLSHLESKSYGLESAPKYIRFYYGQKSSSADNYLSMFLVPALKIGDKIRNVIALQQVGGSSQPVLAWDDLEIIQERIGDTEDIVLNFVRQKPPPFDVVSENP